MNSRGVQFHFRDKRIIIFPKKLELCRNGAGFLQSLETWLSVAIQIKSCFSQHSTNLSDGNQVDCSPPDRHTGAAGAPHGESAQRLSMMGTLGNRKLREKVN